MARSFEPRIPARRPALPVPTQEVFAKIEACLVEAEWLLREHRFFPRTVESLEDLARRVAGERERIIRDQSEREAKTALVERLRAQAAMVR